jgi:pyrroloquinoline quinone biosynthesis protein B
MRLLPLLVLIACATRPSAGPFVVVLGIAQDGGYPQAGCRRADCVSAFESGKGEKVASLGIVDPSSGERWIIDATPDFPKQLHALERVAGPPRPGAPILDGILLTHAHIGHYLGLAHLGREVIGARRVPVFVMPRMRTFLETNGPWSQLVKLENISITTLEEGRRIALNERIAITPLLVPHRDEYSETVGFLVHGPSRSILWLPDIDKWEKWSLHIEDVVASVDVAYLDATFYSEDELPGRNLSEIPHPTVEETMARFSGLPSKSKIRFIHLNQSNPLLRDRAGFPVAREGDREGL